MKRKLIVAVVVVVSVALVIAVIAGFALRPKWVGEGDWAACARIAHVAPADAAEAVARREGVSLGDFRAHVSPAFLNGTGFESQVTCEGGISLAPSGQRLLPGTTDGQDHYSWRVYLLEVGALGDRAPVYLDWDTGVCVFRYDGC